MERKLVTIRKIDEIRIHPNADLLELAIIGGWQCVVKKDEFKEGDMISYFEIDSLIPISEEFEFLRKSSYIKKEYLNNIFENGECFRLRTVKLRKEISQGLIVPLPNKLKSYPEGTDVTVYYGVHKYDPPLSSSGNFFIGLPKGNFPSWGRKTDQERIQNLKKEFQEHYDASTLFEVTIKLDGSSLSFGISPEGEKVVCSRNLSLKLDSEDSKFVSMVNSLGVFEHRYFSQPPEYYGNKLPDISSMLIQGELIGEGIQGNKENIVGNDFYVFDIYCPHVKSYIDADSRYSIVESLGLKHVPILHKAVTLKELGLHSIEDVLKYAEGKSLFATEREGIVFKSINGDFSFKAISNKWLVITEE